MSNYYIVRKKENDEEFFSEIDDEFKPEKTEPFSSAQDAIYIAGTKVFSKLLDTNDSEIHNKHLMNLLEHGETNLNGDKIIIGVKDE